MKVFSISRFKQEHPIRPDEQQQPHLMVCECCDWINSLPVMHPGEKALCARCGHTLTVIYSHWPERILSLSVAALVMFLMAIYFPLIGFSSHGIEQSIHLFDMISVLMSHHFLGLSIIILLLLVILPVSFLLSIIYIAIAGVTGWPLLAKRLAARWLVVVQPWLMVDVFLIGVLVALIKLHSMASIQLGLSFWAYCGFVILFVIVMGLVDNRQLWRWIDDTQSVGANVTGVASQQGLGMCSFCGLSVHLDAQHCPRCQHFIKPERSTDLSKTVALLIASILMYIPANFFPIMDTHSLAITHYSTIIGGVLLLWQMGSYPVAIVIFVASILVPTSKILALCWLCWQSYFPSSQSIRIKQKLYQLTEFVGRWSMIDVFVVALLTSLVQLGGLMFIVPGPAALSFASVVVLTMVAAMSFDPRLLWASVTPEEESIFE
ncbi:PqiA/YebS family transporter subunit [Celerinatantimonas yamalensis]|uniref:Paraquat-inducible protein A n=1 Tax=Celerinatantimonas yamalensis TaxID=559956 RepID=A0ABW9G4I7_9GAMM